jgi:hypothetical protein
MSNAIRLKVQNTAVSPKHSTAFWIGSLQKKWELLCFGVLLSHKLEAKTLQYCAER